MHRRNNDIRTKRRSLSTLFKTLRARADRPGSHRAMEKITFGDNLPGYVCGDPTHPGVVVVQEWWGVTETIRAHALRISKEGYRVLVPDLYKGALGVSVEEAHHLMSNLDWDVATGTMRRERAIAMTTRDRDDDARREPRFVGDESDRARRQN